jgi:hypothetical protein
MNRSIHPIDAAAIGTVALVRLARAVLVPCVALVLVLAGWQPPIHRPWSGPAAVAAVALAAPAPERHGPWYVPDACVPIPGPASLTVAQLRQLARAAGHRTLARSGRRADLLAVLALA